MEEVNRGLCDVRFSLAVPTRDRQESMWRLVTSAMKSAYRPEGIQVVFRVDKDDYKSLSEAKDLAITFRVAVVVGSRGALSDMWEDCLPACVGERLMLCADDVVFRTPGWDEILAQSSPHPRDRVYFQWCQDGIRNHRLATHPVLSRGWIDAAGGFAPRGYAAEFCDTHLWDIAARVADFGHGVRQYFDGVYTEHCHWSKGKSVVDGVYKHRRPMRHLAKRMYEARSGERECVAQRIASYIRGREHDQARREWAGRGLGDWAADCRDCVFFRVYPRWGPGGDEHFVGIPDAGPGRQDRGQGSGGLAPSTDAVVVF